MKNPGYTKTQRHAHWWVTALVAGQYLGQNALVAATQRMDAFSTPSFADFLITSYHSLAGLAILVVLVWRWQLRRKNPVLAAGGMQNKSWAVLARAWHLSLYLALVGMALTGVASYYTDITAATQFHAVGKWVLGTLVIGHVLAGLVHWLVFRDQVLQGMLGISRDADTIRSSD